MDIHPPEGPIRSFKDFVLHLLMIAIAVLLALGAEGLVEHIHNQHLVREARENIIAEIRDNRHDIQDNFPKMAENEKQLKLVLADISKLKSDRKTKLPDRLLNLNLIVLRDSSWKTAGTTGALALMPYNEVKAFATDYDVQATVDRMTQQLLEHWLSMTALSADASKLSNAQLDDLTQKALLSLSHLQAVENICRSLDEEYVKRLKPE